MNDYQRNKKWDLILEKGLTCAIFQKDDEKEQ